MKPIPKPGVPGGRRTRSPALLDLGFRVFFLCAGIYSIVVVSLWTLVFFGVVSLPSPGLNLFQWHAHEMIFGYTLAVIAGFLLTATANWTGKQTLHGWPLAGLAALWLLGRVLFLAGQPAASSAADCLFIGWLTVAVALPVFRARQRRQAGILGKLVLFIPAAVLFGLGTLGSPALGVQLGNYAGLYLIVGLILMMGRRIVPLFIKSGVSETVDPGNPRWLDISSLLLFLVFFVAALIPDGGDVAGLCALALFVVNALRLLAWHTPGIWRRPLVWVLYCGMGFVTLGFLLYVAAWRELLSPYLAVHAFAYGGIGLMTLGMMSRVSLGHTGRSIHSPPLAIQVAFGTLLAGAITRVLLPPLLPSAAYVWCIGLSQGLWIVAFVIFVVVYMPMLLTPRVDGKPPFGG